MLPPRYNINGAVMCAFERCRKHTRLRPHPRFGEFVCAPHAREPALFPLVPEIRIVDDRGESLCHAHGCTKKEKLTFAHKGFFCALHLQRIVRIRKRIDHSGSEEEIKARREEIAFRKQVDGPHLLIVDRLERDYGLPLLQ